MNAENREWLARTLAALPLPQRVVEIGSRDVNGAVRDLFGDTQYTGIDLLPGAGVDVVADGADWQPAEPVDMVVCCNVLEHAPEPAGLIEAAYRMLADNGALLLSTTTDPWPPHSAIDGAALRDGEHYRNVTLAELREWMERFDRVDLWPLPTGQVFCLAVKGELPKTEPRVWPCSTRGMNGETTCTVCHRALYVEDGPTCPECQRRLAR